MVNYPFKGGNTITQSFGQRPEYYGQFGLAGHEGLDIVPSDTDRTIYCIEDGEVVRDIDDPRSGAYGIYCVILNRETLRAWWYAHASVNNVSIGQKFKRGDKIAVMGGTGNTQGDHLHLGLRLADSFGEAINTNNGFQGFVDPLPILNELNGKDNQPDSVVVEGATFLKLVGNSLNWDATVKYLEITTDPKDTPLEAVKSVIGGFKSRTTDLGNQLTNANAELKNREDQVGRLKEQVLQEQQLRSGLTDSLNSALKKLSEVQTVYEGQLAQKQAVINGLAKNKGELGKQIAILQAENQKLKTNVTANLTIADLFTALAKKIAGRK
jgi:murein DD-endopeptidase MepM/ murein hydrolase activator NlpD